MLAQRPSQYYCALQSLHKVLPRTSLHYKYCARYLQITICITKLAQSTSQNYFILKTLHTEHFPVLLCITKLSQGTSQSTKLAQSTFQCYFVFRILHKVLARSTLYYKASHTLHISLHAPHFFTLDTSLSTLHAPRYTPHTPHYTLHTSHAPLHTSHYTLHTTLHTAHSTFHTSHVALHHTSHSPLHTSHFSTLHHAPSHFTRPTPHSTLHTPHFTLHTPHFTPNTSHSTLHKSQCTFTHPKPSPFVTSPTDSGTTQLENYIATFAWVSQDLRNLTKTIRKQSTTPRPPSKKTRTLRYAVGKTAKQDRCTPLFVCEKLTHLRKLDLCESNERLSLELTAGGFLVIACRERLREHLCHLQQICSLESDCGMRFSPWRIKVSFTIPFFF